MDKKIRDIRLVFLVFTAIFSFIGYKTYGSTWSIVYFCVAASLLAMLIFTPARLKPLFNAWLKFSSALGWINTRILLGLFFYLIITPVGIVKKLVTRKSMLSKDKRESYWDSCDIAGLTDTDRYKKQF